MEPEKYAEQAVDLLDRLVIMVSPESKARFRDEMANLFRIAGKEAINDNKVPARTEAIWAAYATAYFKRYGHEPLDGIQVRSQMKAFLKRVPYEEAPALVQFYVNHPDRMYTINRHPFGFCLRDVQRLHSEWKRGAVGSAKTAHATSQLDRIRRGEL